MIAVALCVVPVAWYIVMFKIVGIIRAGGNAIMRDMGTNSTESALTDAFFGNLISYFLVLFLFILVIAVMAYAQRDNREVYMVG